MTLLERLRERIDRDDFFLASSTELFALLAVVQSADDFWHEMVGVRLDPQQTFHFNDLGKKLAPLTTGDSQESPPKEVSA